MTDVTLPLWAVVALIIGALGPFVALAGHGTIAWVAIRRFFERVSRRIKEVEEKADCMRAEVEATRNALMTDVLNVKTEVLARVDAVSADLGDGPDLTTLRAELLADLKGELVQVVAAINESMKMNLLAHKSAKVREIDAVTNDLIEAGDPRARALVDTLGRKRGMRAARVLESLREIQDDEAAGNSLLARFRQLKPPG